MTEPLVVALGARFADDVVEAIQAVDPRIQTVQLHPNISRFPDTLTEDERAEAIRQLADAEVIFGGGGLPPEYLEAAPRLKWFQVMTAGVDRLASSGALSRGFTVTTVRGMTAPAIAEWVIAAMVILEKGIHIAIREQREHKWGFRFTGELTGKTVGIVGMGAIGRETARRARVFGMRVLATRRTIREGDRDDDCDEMLPHTALDSLLERSDYVVLCLPLTEETRGSFGAREFALMKPTARFLNIARGAIVDQGAMIRALQDGTIAAAALDVTEPEPLPPDSPLWDMENVMITPHISGAIEGYGHRSAEVFLENLRRYIAGEPLQNIVNSELGY